ncbi:hypothetical protein B9J09_02250 [Xylella fastidiosa subsp. pauca]|nr:hypothetical protein B9J09_02250 [Xylella fastidiosa subsp. pauca]AVI20215.1 hypothetical protein BCV75_02120 [Xylella fastidiosa]ETE34967.1 hypothetical protein B398_02220 [Xylella fastidiosa 32]OJZ72490.1 hypothetical protein B375_0202305 [Xylella fastidiosa 6c]AVI22214.1 hypothetical protein BC375_02140 [Xylella fastidiosa]
MIKSCLDVHQGDGSSNYIGVMLQQFISVIRKGYINEKRTEWDSAERIGFSQSFVSEVAIKKEVSVQQTSNVNVIVK